MKQKIVIKVAKLCCKKCKSRAMKIVVEASGVTKVEIGGDKDQLVVIGEDVDSVKLTRCLRKKLRYAILLSVQEEKEEKKQEKKEEKKEEGKICILPWPPTTYPQYPICCDDPPPFCFIL